ncbi:hypothetical protein HCH_07026 [Hahella chejuensis KCTC 2396]|uniref:Uncharacterized protein n=1 Tax=Hahella chejuensis (strain KCTC 2396) TaxID=349521 RepID=Q2S6T2_HAHCH|nr:hypothetical protein HCH_07026 [Hahella chejuensis KCTC 2396]
MFFCFKSKCLSLLLRLWIIPAAMLETRVAAGFAAGQYAPVRKIENAAVVKAEWRCAPIDAQGPRYGTTGDGVFIVNLAVADEFASLQYVVQIRLIYRLTPESIQVGDFRLQAQVGENQTTVWMGYARVGDAGRQSESQSR